MPSLNGRIGPCCQQIPNTFCLLLPLAAVRSLLPLRSTVGAPKGFCSFRRPVPPAASKTFGANWKRKDEHSQWDNTTTIHPLSNPQDFTKCVQEMRDGLESPVAEWCRKGEGFGCIVDFTGGTKCMSAALALVARPWPKSSFSYVGGKERDQNNVGVVISGREQVVRSTNPWDALGYQVVEDAVAAFNRHAFGEGARMLKDATTRIDDDSSRRSELNALAMFMNAYDLWSRSEYGRALDEFENCGKRLNDLVESLRPAPKKRIRGYLNQAKSRLNSLKKGLDRPTLDLLEDLISDAARRRREGRHVDVVARPLPSGRGDCTTAIVGKVRNPYPQGYN